MMRSILVGLAGLVGLTGAFIGLCAQAGLVEDWSTPAAVLDARFSPKGDYLAVLREVEEKRVVVVYTYPKMKVSTVLSYPGKNEVGGFFWASDTRIVANIVEDFTFIEGGISRGELFAINADGSKPKHLFGFRAGAKQDQGSRTAKTRNEYASARVINLLKGNPEEVLVNILHWSRGYSNVSEAAHLNLYTGKLSNRVRAPVSGASLAADQQGNVLFAYSTSDDFETVIHERNLKTRQWSEFSRTQYGNSVMTPLLVAKDGRIYVRYGQDNGPEGIYLMDPKTQKLELVYQDELVDAQLMYDRDYQVYGVFVEPNKPVFISLDDNHPNANLRLALKKLFPQAHPFVGDSTDDGRYQIAGLRRDNKTTEYFLYDNKVKQLKMLFDARPAIDDAVLPTMRPVTITARDGVEMHGYLNIPAGHEAKDLPFLIVPHGGPHGPRDSWGFDWFAGIIPAAGYATLQINYRGSGGYGMSFEKLGHREWAKKMQDDLTDATRWAIAEGVADPARTCIFGWSYGGYAALMSIIREPDLYRCSVAGAGVYDQDIQYEKSDFAEFTRWGKKYVDQVIGPTAADRAQASPVTYVDKIKTPLMLVHGEKDARVPIEHLDALLKAMDKAGKPKPEVLRLPREGHGPRKPEHWVKMWTQVFAFLERHIGPGVQVPGSQQSSAAAAQ